VTPSGGGIHAIKAAGEPLLFKGNDFIQTDVARC
jgi:uncharacterized protein with PIN domain